MSDCLWVQPRTSNHRFSNLYASGFAGLALGVARGVDRGRDFADIVRFPLVPSFARLALHGQMPGQRVRRQANAEIDCRLAFEFASS